MSRAGGIRCIRYVDDSFQEESNGRQADFIAAGLVVKLEREMGITEGSGGKSSQRKVDDDGISVHVELLILEKLKVCRVPFG